MGLGDPVARARVRHSAQFAPRAWGGGGVMGSGWCRHRRAVEDHGGGGGDPAGDDEGFGPPAPGGPKVDSRGRRLLISPSSGMCRLAQRTPSEDLPDLPRFR